LDSPLIKFAYFLIGLALSLVGLKKALSRLGEIMAKQLTDPTFITGAGFLSGDLFWCFSFGSTASSRASDATTIAEPSRSEYRLALLYLHRHAAAFPHRRRLRHRNRAEIYPNKDLVPLAYNSGGVRSITLTVPLITALGLG
jgi:hypothetical protein